MTVFFPLPQFALPVTAGGSAPASCTLQLFCLSAPPSATIAAYGVANVLTTPWDENTLSWYTANVTGGYPFGAGYRAVAAQAAVPPGGCAPGGTPISLDLTLLCQWAVDNNANYVSVGLMSSAPLTAPVTIASKEFVAPGGKAGSLGAQLFMTESQVTSTSALALTVSGSSSSGGAPPAKAPAGRRLLQPLSTRAVATTTAPQFSVAAIPTDQVQAAVAQAVPGLAPLAVNVQVTSYSVRSTVVVSVPRLDVSSRSKLTNLTLWSTSVQNDFTAALALDGGLPGAQVSISAMSVLNGGVAIPFR